MILENNVKFSAKTCPLIFFNTTISFLVLKEISASFLERNVLEFQDINYENHSIKLNSDIYHCKMRLYRISLSSKLLNKYIFEKMFVLDLEGQISEIQNELFKSFKYLRFVRFRMQNIRNLFVRKNTWLEHLNDDLDIDPRDSKNLVTYNQRIIVLVLQQLFYNLTFYDYPNQDFCLFKNFPHRKLVWPRLKPNFKTDCSCTEVFLLQYSYPYYSSIISNLNLVVYQYYMSTYYTEDYKTTKKIYSHCLNNSFPSTLSKCNFKQRLHKCDLTEFKTANESKKTYFYMADWEFLVKDFHAIFYLYGNLGFSFLALIFCVLIILILAYTKPAKESKIMYSFLMVNSIFNVIFISIKCLKPVDVCFNEYFSCMGFFEYKSIYTQYFDFFIKLFGKTFKSASNLTHIAFVLSRYFMIAKSKSDTLKKISVKIYVLIILFISFCLNFHVYFQYSFIKKPLSSVDLIMSHEETVNDYRENFSPSEYIILNFFQYLSIIFSDLAYILITLIIDLVLVIYIRKTMKRSHNLGNFVRNVNSTTNHMVENLRNVEKKRKKKKESIQNRITWMIVLNSINFTLFRLPLAVLSLYGFIFYYDSKTKEYRPSLSSYIVCRYFKFCLNLQELLHAFYLLSFIFQFIIFFKFDKNFREGFSNLKKKSIRKNFILRLIPTIFI